MSDYGDMFDGLAFLSKYVFATLCVFVPLGLWKFAEILVWVMNHLVISWE